MSCTTKIVVFDLDETLGYFTEFGIFWDAISNYIIHNDLYQNTIQINDLFNKTLDLYPEFLRPNILTILKYICSKQNKCNFDEDNKTKNTVKNNRIICNRLMIYTNNQGPTKWTKYIIEYFRYKLGFNVFDQVISAFKINNKHVELCRTSHLKTHDDLIRCTKLPIDTQICFIDDNYHIEMTNKKIYYINVRPYIYSLSFSEMIIRFLNTNIFEMNNNDKKKFHSYILNYMTNSNFLYFKKPNIDQHIDEIISTKILQHLHIFFRNNADDHYYTKKNKFIKMKKTRKHI